MGHHSSLLSNCDMVCRWLVRWVLVPPSAKLARLRMMDDGHQINFDAPASLRKWASLKNVRNSDSLYPAAYLLVDGTLDDCIREFMAKPISQRHLYEIHTAPQGELVSAVLSARHIVEIDRLRDFL
jgi:hypothetical protein